MTGRLEMLKRMRVCGILATTDMTARETYAELVPRCPNRETFLAATCPWRYLLNLARMFARLRKSWHILSIIQPPAGASRPKCARRQASGRTN